MTMLDEQGRAVLANRRDVARAALADYRLAVDDICEELGISTRREATRNEKNARSRTASPTRRRVRTVRTIAACISHSAAHSPSVR